MTTPDAQLCDSMARWLILLTNKSRYNRTHILQFSADK